MRDAGHRTPDAGHRTSDNGHRTSDGEKSKNNISTPQGGGHKNPRDHLGGGTKPQVHLTLCENMTGTYVSFFKVMYTDKQIVVPISPQGPKIKAINGL